jgi:hypothetical protein
LHRSGLREFEPEVEFLRGRSLAAAGDKREGERALRRARSVAEELGHGLVSSEIVTELGRLVGGEEGAKLLATARRLVERIAASLDDETLKQSFLARRDVVAMPLDASGESSADQAGSTT